MDLATNGSVCANTLSHAFDNRPRTYLSFSVRVRLNMVLIFFSFICEPYHKQVC